MQSPTLGSHHCKIRKEKGGGHKTWLTSLFQVFSGPLHTNDIGNSDLKFIQKITIFRLCLEELFHWVYHLTECCLQGSQDIWWFCLWYICSNKFSRCLGWGCGLVVVTCGLGCEFAAWYHQQKSIGFWSMVSDSFRPQNLVYKVVV